MILNDAYAALKRVRLVANHAAFSTAYLNKGPRYFDHLVCSRKRPAVDALVSLLARIRAIADAFSATPSLEAQAAEMAELADALWAELERRCCSLLPERRERSAAAEALP